MGRRRLWIIVGIALALAVAVLAIALIFQRPGFRFLQGQPVLDVREFRGIRRESYSWQAEWSELDRIAREEAAALGYALRPSSETETNLTGEDPFPVQVVLHKDWRFTNGTFSRNQPGWVMVEVFTEPRGLWDRIKAVFGL